MYVILQETKTFDIVSNQTMTPEGPETKTFDITNGAVRFSTVLTDAPQRKIDPFKVLGLSKDATYDSVKKAFRQLALGYHPDKNKSPDAEERFKEIRRACENLTTAKHDASYSPSRHADPSDSGYSALSRQEPPYASHADWQSSGGSFWGFCAHNPNY
ncbi:hypothetical protein HPB50_017024 [Hyalomma asiaticum]|uniref:Uncharacterized protein n=1 Tax=Hyalomma asiaticum TaxID=266040 RepID=A0ACB7RJL1_HYAAI|nr:hypothetical protein HPB50_017024 [Hyalomma asiaticum]